MGGSEQPVNNTAAGTVVQTKENVYAATGFRNGFIVLVEFRAPFPSSGGAIYTSLCN